MDRVKVGVLGAGRGDMMMKYCLHSDNAELVAVCDFNEYFLTRAKVRVNSDKVTYYTDFEDFIKHDMDAVILANYATDHVPFAIRCLEAGKNVISEVLPCETPKEAVELAEAVEKSDKIYAYAENYCFMPSTREMRRLYREGKLGEFEYGEGEYLHNCESIWYSITQGNPMHWRNLMYASYYCTHSAGPLIHISGLRPVRVTAFELPYNARQARMGAPCGLAAVEMIELENGAYIKSIHGDGISKNSIWYTAYGPMGRMESAREDAQNGAMKFLYTNLDSYEGENDRYKYIQGYAPTDELSEKAEAYGHGGADYYCMWNFFEKIKGNPDADVIGVYEALDMGFVGQMGYRSIMKGSVPVEIPDFRSKLVREKYRYDTHCTNPAKAGDMLLPTYSKGDLIIPDSIYEAQQKQWDEKVKEEMGRFVEVKEAIQ
ncbi:MAG: Gfo/Idh/MocA family oxidoreductase [Lachnospiraceae bacterium]|nr:Gfo/Idh/MocA family oxidoreductase [Lachnospiraceae bacterium]